jgi:hypothetical protein
VGQRIVHPAFKWLWKSARQNKHKVFFWLLLNDRLITRDILQRKGMALPSYNCLSCQAGTVETRTHLFFTYPFAVACWSTNNLQVLHNDSFLTLEGFRLQLQIPFFMDFIITMSWCIWMQHNDLIFKGVQRSLALCFQHFRLCLDPKANGKRVNGKIFAPITSDVWTLIRSIKYSLIKKLIT